LAKGNAIKYSEFRHEQAGVHQTIDREEGGVETDAVIQRQIALFPEENSRVN
jgi:hypothetical protein